MSLPRWPPQGGKGRATTNGLQMDRNMASSRPLPGWGILSADGWAQYPVVQTSGGSRPLSRRGFLGSIGAGPRRHPPTAPFGETPPSRKSPYCGFLLCKLQPRSVGAQAWSVPAQPGAFRLTPGGSQTAGRWAINKLLQIGNLQRPGQGVRPSGLPAPDYFPKVTGTVMYFPLPGRPGDSVNDAGAGPYPGRAASPW